MLFLASAIALSALLSKANTLAASGLNTLVYGDPSAFILYLLWKVLPSKSNISTESIPLSNLNTKGLKYLSYHIFSKSLQFKGIVVSNLAFFNFSFKALSKAINLKFCIIASYAKSKSLPFKATSSKYKYDAVAGIACSHSYNLLPLEVNTPFGFGEYPTISAPNLCGCLTSCATILKKLPIALAEVLSLRIALLTRCHISL